jgi:dihydroorotase
LTEEELDGFNSECHLRPPLRSTADRDGLRAGLHDGTINALCSSHQPHERDARLNPFSATDPGASGLDTLLPLALELVRQEVLSLSQAIQSLTHRPATILGVDRGHLRVGGVADVCVFDPKREWTLSTETMVSQGENTPLRGWTLIGRNRFTLVSGDIVFEDA